MQDVLRNMANWLLIEFCKANNIDCSNSRVAKNGRGFKWSLVDYDSGRQFVTITFFKNQVPHYSWRERI